MSLSRYTILGVSAADFNIVLEAYLAKVAKILEKPVIKVTKPKPGYYVVDRDVAYYYEV